MKNISREKKIYIKLAIFALALISLLIYKDYGLSLNRNLEHAFYKLRGEVKPDTNIVLINITKNDFDNLGSWPLKRSYYALLINQLTKFEAKAIGLNIFLSDRISSQSVYGELLINEIKNSGKVVLTSVINNFDEKNNSGSVLFPEPKKFLVDVETGHSNYFDKNGILIPHQLNSNQTNERSFSAALAKTVKENFTAPEVMKVNFISSQNGFTNFSLIEYFEISENESAAKKIFKDKFVIIGISDPQIAVTIKTAFDDELPGLAIQAFALDNIFNNRFIITKYWKVSSIFFGLIIFFLIFSKLRNLIKYSAAFLFFFVISFLLFSFFNVQLQFYIFVVPFLFLGIFEISDFIWNKLKRAGEIENEAELLRKNLNEKENELSKLQSEFEFLGEKNSSELLEKISKLKSEIEDLKQKEKEEIPVEQIQNSANNFHGIIYKSRAMNSVVDLVKKVGTQDATVLILGESGTGKELIAKALHHLNEKRRSNNFIAVNCAALSETLLESELFGHVKGAFTNAVSEKSGRFESADKGTIFLDEIGETSKNFQVKLLRVLQSGEFEKVGSSKTIKTDVRIVAATNKDLFKLVKEKKFREDLFYRLNVIKVELPALRERKDDIPVIAGYFATSENISISQVVFDILNNYEWRGNVRELESAIKHAVIFAKAENRNIIKLSDLPNGILKSTKLNTDELILDSLREKKFSHSSITETAKELNLSRTIVSENFRGNVFKIYYENNFDIDSAIQDISQSEDEEIREKVASKVNTFLRNVESDVRSLDQKNFEEVRSKLNSKYKNLPQKFHSYLDGIIKNLLK